MYLVQRDVCTGNHMSGIGPHSNMQNFLDRPGRPWHRSHRDRTHSCQYSIQEDHRCWETLCILFQKLWAKTKKQSHTTIEKELLFFVFHKCKEWFSQVKCIALIQCSHELPNSGLKSNIMLTWHLLQQSPWAQADPRVNLQVAASQQSFLHSCMKWKQRKAMLTTTLKRLPEYLYSKINEVVTWRVRTKKFFLIYKILIITLNIIHLQQQCFCLWKYLVSIRIYWLSDLKCVGEFIWRAVLYLWFATVTLLSFVQPAIATFSNTNHIWWGRLVFQTSASSTEDQCLKVSCTAAAETGGTTTR